MKFIIVIIFAYFGEISSVEASDSLSYSCKYRYIKQKDSTNVNSKFDDIMILTINKSTSTYYSYLKQFGLRNLENTDLSKDATVDNTKGIVSVDGNSKSTGKYFTQNESEIIKIDYKNKNVTVSDKLVSRAYFYNDTLISPIWNIENDTSTILNQKCQKATTTFKGRKFTAWFASSISYNMGPWLFNGLPGLILKVQDSKNQFSFECIELNTQSQSTKVFKAYTESKKIDKSKLKAKKKLFSQNILSFMEAEDGVTMTSTDNAGNVVPRKIKPYNPIDLTQ
jgi:GLPGLI family protein